MPIRKKQARGFRWSLTFCERRPCVWICIKFMYDSLRTVYPFEFICLARKYNKSSPGRKRLIQETMSFVK